MDRRRKAGASAIDPKTLPGLVLDDKDAIKRGTWSESSSIGGYIGTSYLHDNNQNKGELSATFKFTLKEPGEYEVRIAYTPNANRASNVPISIQHAGGESKARVNQKESATIDKGFFYVGKFRFEREAIITISNTNTNGYVVIDAVQLVPAK